MSFRRALSPRPRERAVRLFAAGTLAAVLVTLSLTGAAAAQQWAQFRGPNAGVADDDPSLPDTWSETENVIWKTPVPGMGWSSPVVWGDHIFVTSAVSAGKELAP